MRALNYKYLSIYTSVDASRVWKVVLGRIKSSGKYENKFVIHCNIYATLVGDSF